MDILKLINPFGLSIPLIDPIGIGRRRAEDVTLGELQAMYDSAEDGAPEMAEMDFLKLLNPFGLPIPLIDPIGIG